MRRFTLILILIFTGAVHGEPTELLELRVGIRHNLLPETDDSHRLSHAGRVQRLRRAQRENADWLRKSAELSRASETLINLGAQILVQLHGGEETRRLVERVRGPVTYPDVGFSWEGPIDGALLPTAEWEGLKKDFTDLKAVAVEGTDGRKGSLTLVYRGETAEKIMGRLEPDPLRRFTREARMDNLFSDFVGYVGGELAKRWTGWDPNQSITSAHSPGARETASQGSGHIRNQ